MAIPPFRGFHIGGSPLVILRLQVPVGLTEQTGEQRHKGDTDERDTAAGHQLFHPQLGVKTLLDGGRRRTKNLYGVVKRTDRKSTRLNSSHQIISYAVF